MIQKWWTTPKKQHFTYETGCGKPELTKNVPANKTWTDSVLFLQVLQSKQ